MHRIYGRRGAPRHGCELRAQRGHQQGHDEGLLQAHRRHSPLRQVHSQEKEATVNNNLDDLNLTPDLKYIAIMNFNSICDLRLVDFMCA